MPLLPDAPQKTTQQPGGSVRELECRGLLGSSWAAAGRRDIPALSCRSSQQNPVSLGVMMLGASRLSGEQLRVPSQSALLGGRCACIFRRRQSTHWLPCRGRDQPHSCWSLSPQLRPLVSWVRGPSLPGVRVHVQWSHTGSCRRARSRSHTCSAGTVPSPSHQESSSAKATGCTCFQEQGPGSNNLGRALG